MSVSRVWCPPLPGDWVNQEIQQSITSGVGIAAVCTIQNSPVPAKMQANVGRLVLAAFLLLVLLSLSPVRAAAQYSQPTPDQTAKPASQTPPTNATRNTHPTATSIPNFPGSPMGKLAPYNGQNVSSIQVAGRIDVDSAKFAPQFVQKLDQPFSEKDVDQTAAAIQSAGKFRGMRIDVNPEPKGVRVIYVVQPAVYYGIFKFPGAEQFSYARLLQVSNYPVQAPFNSAEVEQDRQALLKFYRQEGYFQAGVQSQTEVEPHAIVNVSFPATLGRHAKFGEIVIEGASAPQQEKLRHALQTLCARLRTAAIRPGKTYHYSTLAKGTNYLQNQLHKEGFLGADVKLAGAEYHADTNRADIHFSVKTGPTVKVDIKGVHLWPWTRKSLLPEYQGIGVDQESVAEGTQALSSYFQKKGYFDVKVDSQFHRGPGHDTVLYSIDKDSKHKVEDVKLTGNRQVSSDKLKPQIAVQKEHLFSVGKFSNQLVEDSVKNLKAVYESEGFSSVTVTPEVKHKGGNIYVTFRVDEGPRDIVASLKVEGADTFPPSKYAPDGLKLAAGQPYSQARVKDDRTTIVANYLRAGYLNSSFRETANTVSKNEPHRINVVYHIYEGPRVLTGDIVTLGRLHTDQELINREVSNLKPEKPLTETDLMTAGSKLYDQTGVFDWAEVDPKTQVTTQTTEDVLVKVHEAKKNDFTYGFGFEVINRGGSIPSGTVALPNLPPVGLPTNFKTNQKTFWGPRGTFQYTRNDFRGKGESLSFTGFGGRLRQSGAFYYINPNFRWTDWRATSSFSAVHDAENPIFSSQQETGGVQIQRYIDRAQKTTLFLRYQFSQTNLTNVLIPDLVLPADRNVQLSTFAVNTTRDTRDNILDSHRGWLETIELDENSTKVGSSVNFAKMTAQVANYRPVFPDRTIWANSIRIGLAQPYSNSRVPLSEEFFTGGGNTLRGFPLDGAGPQRQVRVCPNGASTCNTFIQVPAGGHEMLILNSELRIPLSFIKDGLGVVPFYDGGNVFPVVGFNQFTSLYSNNVGIGFRYATPVGPIRVDFGRNLNPVPGINAFQYFISIGQAF
jgi:outer membrane protein insertion porin family